MDICADNRQRLAGRFRECLDAFYVLGDPHRQEIILILLESDTFGMSVQDITSRMPISRPAVSYHLKALKGAGIVQVVGNGTSNLYSLNADSSIWSRLRELSEDICEVIDAAKKASIIRIKEE